MLRRPLTGLSGGMFAGQFTTLLEGDYRIELQPPHGDEGELLVQEVRVRIPARETERPERNDALLRSLTERAGGTYFVGFDSALGRRGAGTTPLSRRLLPEDRVSYVTGAPDREFERLLMTWLMGLICGALSLEWLIRRLNRLA